MTTATTTDRKTATHSLVGITPQTLAAWLAEGQVELIDVREDFEHAVEHIAGSKLRALSTFDPEAVRREAQGRKVVFYCRSGRRSADAGNRYAYCTEGREPVFHLEGGIVAWGAVGLPTQRHATAPKLDVMRQVQLIIGTLVLAFISLGWFVEPAFLILGAMVGGGLIFAGATGTCALAMLVGRMPWNRLPGGIASCATCSPNVTTTTE